MMFAVVYILVCFFFFFKQKTAYEMRISDWSSDVCSSDLLGQVAGVFLERVIGVLGRCRIRRASLAQRLDGGVEILRRHPRAGQDLAEIGRASCRERVCQYV